MDESRIGQYSISVTTYPIMALVSANDTNVNLHISYLFLKIKINQYYLHNISSSLCKYKYLSTTYSVISKFFFLNLQNENWAISSKFSNCNQILLELESCPSM